MSANLFCFNLWYLIYSFIKTRVAININSNLTWAKEEKNYLNFVFAVLYCTALCLSGRPQSVNSSFDSHTSHSLGAPGRDSSFNRYPTLLYFTDFTVLYCTLLYFTVLYCTLTYFTVLYFTVLYCTVLISSVLYIDCTEAVLYCTVLYCSVATCGKIQSNSLSSPLRPNLWRFGGRFQNNFWHWPSSKFWNWFQRWCCSVDNLVLILGFHAS